MSRRRDRTSGIDLLLSASTTNVLEGQECRYGFQPRLAEEVEDLRHAQSCIESRGKVSCCIIYVLIMHDDIYNLVTSQLLHINFQYNASQESHRVRSSPSTPNLAQPTPTTRPCISHLNRRIRLKVTPISHRRIFHRVQTHHSGRFTLTAISPHFGEKIDRDIRSSR